MRDCGFRWWHIIGSGLVCVAQAAAVALFTCGVWQATPTTRLQMVAAMSSLLRADLAGSRFHWSSDFGAVTCSVASGCR
jgi:hypothetical protein